MCSNVPTSAHGRASVSPVCPIMCKIGNETRGSLSRKGGLEGKSEAGRRGESRNQVQAMGKKGPSTKREVQGK